MSILDAWRDEMAYRHHEMLVCSAQPEGAGNMHGGGAPAPPVLRAHDKPIPRADAILMSAGRLCAQAISKRKGSEERLRAISDATSILEAAWEAVIEEQRLLEGVPNGSA